MRMVEKTCQNPDCGHVEELPEETRWCPKCKWEVRPWSFYRGEEEKRVEATPNTSAANAKEKGRKRRVGLICPNCGHEYPG